MGDYSIPRMIVRPSEQPPSGTIVDEATLSPDEPKESEFWGSFGTRSKKAKKRSYHGSAPTLVRTFSSLRFAVLKPRSNFEKTCEPAVSDGSSQNIGEVLIHSSLYVLADNWGIDSLKRLTLSKIHKTLTMICLDLPKLGRIIEFVRYAYSNERTLDLETEMDELRELICQYLAAYAELTTWHTSFPALMEEERPFSRVRRKLVAPRINPTKADEVAYMQ